VRTLTRTAGETWRQALARYLDEVDREEDDALGGVTADDVAATLRSFDRHVARGVLERDALAFALYECSIPGARIVDQS
jgi:hypothetical protein